MVRCMRVESGLPPFLPVELMMAASHICKRIPHSALTMETSYKKLYGNDADLSHLKLIGARAFVHIKNPNKLGHTSWEGMVCGFNETVSTSSKNASRDGEQERHFHRNTAKLVSRGQAALAGTRSRVTVVRFQ